MMNNPNLLASRCTPVLQILLLCGLLSACQNAETATATPGETALNPIEQLQWMNGTWQGPLGDQIIEEHWSAATAGSVAALVRFFRGSETQIIELLTIRQGESGLEMLIQQWSGDMTPLNPAPQRMKVESQGPRRVVFASASPGGMKRLDYHSPDASTLVIAVELTEGAQFELGLKRQSP